MNIDTRVMFGRFVVARYGLGAPTIKEIATDRTKVIHEDRMPTDEAGFDALFTEADADD